MQDDRSDTPAGRVLQSLPSRGQAILGSLLEKPLSGREMLHARVTEYLRGLEDNSERAEFLDVKTARLLGRKCIAMLGKLNDGDEVAERLIQAAVLYFIEYDDADHDFQSLSGFDDDLEVVDAVARELGLRDVLAMTRAESD